ncbi:MAG TPA: peptidyl-prolyl cis-trans isomerase [Myxococcales bacterium]
MTTRLAAIFLAAAAFAACSKSSKSSGPVVAKVGDQVITASDVKERLNETSPFLRARYNTLERKKEFVENLVRNELLAQEAVRQGFDKSPAVKEQAKRAMIQELIKHQLDEKLTGADISEDEMKKFYQTHIDDFVKPERARVYHIFLPATTAKEKAEAKKKATALLKDISAREQKGEASAFQGVAMRESKDMASSALGGDLRFLSRDELTRSYSKELADAAFSIIMPGAIAGPVETPTGIELVKMQVKTVAMNHSFEESKDSIRQRMARERRSRDYDEWLKKLRESTAVTINDAELEKVQPDAATPVPAVPHTPPQFTSHSVMVPAAQATPPAQNPAPAQATTPPAQTPPTTTSKIGGN